jgi:hypothetical protein
MFKQSLSIGNIQYIFMIHNFLNQISHSTSLITFLYPASLFMIAFLYKVNRISMLSSNILIGIHNLFFQYMKCIQQKHNKKVSPIHVSIDMLNL